jgi:putative multiple sugar transport system substrate-binding protein
MRKFFAVLLAFTIIASLMVGCKKTEGGLIGIAMPEMLMYWVKNGISLKAQAEERGYSAEVRYGDEKDQSVQNEQIQDLLSQGARLLIVGPLDEGVGSVIAEAAKANVAVIAYDRIISDSEDYDYYITFNNFKVGVLQAQSIADGLNLNAATSAEPKYIALFAGMPTDDNAFFFFDGAMSVLNPYIDSGVLRVVGPYARTSADTANFMKISTEGGQASVAKARMESLLKNDARSVTLDAVLAPNDTLARAIVEACKADAKYSGNLPIISGYGAEFDSVKSIKNDGQYSTVFKDTAKLAEAAIILADQILKKQPINIPGAVLAEGDLAEIGNTGKKNVNAYLLDPILVTKDNLLVPVDAGLYESFEARELRQ